MVAASRLAQHARQLKGLGHTAPCLAFLQPANLLCTSVPPPCSVLGAWASARRPRQLQRASLRWTVGARAARCACAEHAGPAAAPLPGRTARAGSLANAVHKPRPCAPLPPTDPLPQDPRFMYLSLDEACTHVGATAFRLVAGIYNRQGSRLLGTAVSPPIR